MRAHILQKISLLSSAAPVSISLVVQYSNTKFKALTAFCQKRILPFSKPTDTVKREARNFTSALYKAGVLYVQGNVDYYDMFSPVSYAEGICLVT